MQGVVATKHSTFTQNTSALTRNFPPRLRMQVQPQAGVRLDDISPNDGDEAAARPKEMNNSFSESLLNFVKKEAGDEVRYG